MVNFMSSSRKVNQSYFKTKKIYQLISNIYIYKFPPVLKWPEGIYVDIPVDFIIAIRKMLEHSSEFILYNLDELCFAINADYSSYGDKIIIIPIEFITEKYNKALFFDTFAHELGHALSIEVLSNTATRKAVQHWHKIITYYSQAYNKNLFFNPQLSKHDFAKYQLEDYKEFFPELFMHLLNHYDDLSKHINKIPYNKAKFAYLSFSNMLLNYVQPFSVFEKQNLIKNL